MVRSALLSAVLLASSGSGLAWAESTSQTQADPQPCSICDLRKSNLKSLRAALAEKRAAACDGAAADQDACDPARSLLPEPRTGSQTDTGS
jgi:hypothetical protein